MSAPVSRRQYRFMTALLSGCGADGKKKEDVEKCEDHEHGRAAACVVISDSGGQILTGISASTGLMELPGGHAEKDETFEETARRELKEETGIEAIDMIEIGNGRFEGNHAAFFLVTKFKGSAKDSSELKSVSFRDVLDLPVDTMRGCAVAGLNMWLDHQELETEAAHAKMKMLKSLKGMVFAEELKKNIIRSQVGSGVVHDMTHGDALKLVGNGTFRFLRKITKDMGDEDFREVKIDMYTLHLRKHSNDVYSGRITDGHKLVHQWTNRSLPAMAAELMSVFEWYSPGDEKELMEVDEKDLSDEAIEGGLSGLVDKYKKHNIGEIYGEMEHIREEIRSGSAVDIQQVEQKIMKLFDKLEASLHSHGDKHNALCQESGKEIDALHAKLLDLQSKIDSLGKHPSKVEAFSSNPANPDHVYDDGYMYLPKPRVTITPDGRITIEFENQWNGMDRENFLKDMKAKVLKKRVK